jgi:hypothetical protein
MLVIMKTPITLTEGFSNIGGLISFFGFVDYILYFIHEKMFQ